MKNKIKILFMVSVLLFSLLMFSSCQRLFGTRMEPAIFGYVRNDGGPVEGAVVRIQATEMHALTNEKGFFMIEDTTVEGNVVVTAWTEGHYISWTETEPATFPITIRLAPYSTADNLNYAWSATEDGQGSIGCAECHPAYDEWLNDSHSQSAVNPRFITMYSGTDIEGNLSPPTEYGSHPEYGIYALLPDPEVPYYGPGYKLDFPDSAGNCAACHVPTQAAYPGREYTSDPTLAAGIETEGIFCDFCHKIGAVNLDPKSGLPRENMPGVLSIQLFRPEEDGEDLFLGNFDDVVGPDSYLPLYEESQYCAPCHFGEFWDTTVYNSFGEWLESPFSNADSGQTCQECHMPPVDYTHFVYPDKGGVARDPERIRDHDMTGFMEEELLQNAVSLSAEAEIAAGKAVLSVGVVNDQTGHAVPTDHPLRQVILVVEAKDGTGARLTQIEGETIPFYGGEGDPSAGYYAGEPGKIYMKVLQEIWTEVYPSGAYWNPTRVLSDNRLMPFEADSSRFVFDMGEAEQAAFTIRLLFRRATKDLMDQKGWDVPDILMEETTLLIEQ